MEVSLNNGNSKEAFLPGLRQDLRLLRGDIQANGAPAWRIHDPIRNRFYDIGWIEYELLKRWRDGMTPTELIELTSFNVLLDPTPEEVNGLLSFLQRHQLLSPSTQSARDALRKLVVGQKPSLWNQLLHSYLFFRVPLLHPDAWLTRTLPMVSWVFSRGFFWLTLLAGGVGVYLSSRQSEAVFSAFNYFFNFQGMLLYGMAAGFAKIIHELGHAYTAKRLGLRVPTMGLAFLVMMPVLYTDTSESWKLARSQDRFAVGFAGMGFELILAAWATLLWSIMPESGLRSSVFLLASTTWVMTLLVNLSPFMRFDGYFLLSDLVGIPNLHERSFALARNQIRKTFFGYERPNPEPELSQATQRHMVMFALACWVYRLVLFLGIALVVYNLFFKLLGIFLFLVEIIWFVFLPIWKEAKEIMSERKRWHIRLLPWVMVCTLLAGTVWVLPVGHEVSAPALARAKVDAMIFAPVSGRIAELNAAEGRRVKQGDILMKIESPDLVSRLERAHQRAEGYATELARSASGTLQRERRAVLEEQLGEALADENGARVEINSLIIKSPYDGVVVDIPPEIIAGRWVNGKHPLFRIVDLRKNEIEAYLSETQIEHVALGQKVRFYPDMPELPVIHGTISAIDTTAGHMLSHPLLASLFGGGIVATKNAQEQLIAHEAVYRVRVQTDPGSPNLQQVARGNIRFAADWTTVGENSLARMGSVFIRESGF